MSNSAGQSTVTRASRIPLKRRLLYSFVVVCVFFGSVEGLARLLAPSELPGRFQQIRELVLFLGTHESDLMLEPDPDRFWKLRPNIRIDDAANSYWQGTVSNSLGFRSPEFKLDRDPGVFRIVCFGDSSTFGIGTTMDNTWPFQLEQRLNQELVATGVVRFEVINAGVPGYTSHQGLQHMRQELDRLKPDLVFASYANNDFWHWDNTTDAEHARRIAGNAVSNVLFQSRAVQLLDSAIRSQRTVPTRAWAANATGSYFNPHPAWIRRVPLDVFGANIEAMIGLGASREVPVIPVLWPDQALADCGWSVRVDYHEVLKQLAARHRLPVADVTSEFQRNRPHSVQSYVPNDIVHVNGYGNALAAQAALDSLRPFLPIPTSTSSDSPIQQVVGVKADGQY